MLNLNPKNALKLAPAALAVVAALGSPLSAFAAPAVTLGADNAIESNEQGSASANVPVSIAADGSWLDRGGVPRTPWANTLPRCLPRFPYAVSRQAPTPSVPSIR